MTFSIQLYIHLSGVIYRLIILYQQNVKCKTFHYALILRLKETFKSSKSFKIWTFFLYYFYTSSLTGRSFECFQTGCYRPTANIYEQDRITDHGKYPKTFIAISFAKSRESSYSFNASRSTDYDYWLSTTYINELSFHTILRQDLKNHRINARFIIFLSTLSDSIANFSLYCCICAR